MLAAKGTPQKSTSKKKILLAFFEAHILGIMQQFSEILDNPRETYPVVERKRCVGAIGLMITLAEYHVGIALPQVWTHP
jgi:serine/threonine-protein kinase ATR